MPIFTLKTKFKDGTTDGPAYRFNSMAELMHFARSWTAAGGKFDPDEIERYRLPKQGKDGGETKAKKQRPAHTGGRTTQVQHFRSKRPGRSKSHPYYGKGC
jgi:hypothetical protein